MSHIDRGGPPGGGGPTPEAADHTTNTTSRHQETGSAEYIAGLRRRRAATYRLPQLECGCVETWPHKCDSQEPSEQSVDGYAAAARHLLDYSLLPAPQLAEMRRLWNRKGRDRQLVQHIAERWVA